jgi:hypothetical protein
MKQLRDVTRSVFIVAYKENTEQLEDYFRRQGFTVFVSRKQYSDREMSYAAVMRCLMNHRDVWQIIANEKQHAIVVEADFVPIEHFSEAEAPFDPQLTPAAVGWLYAGGPVLYEIDEFGYAIGHSSTMVALLIGAQAASALLAFADKEIQESGGKYVPWDTYLSHHLRRGMDIPTYIPFKQYGEHGGLPNQEHAQFGMRSWHQGDILAGPLAFLPLYAQGSWWRYRFIRLRARLRGWLRLVLGRYLEMPAFRGSKQKGLLLAFALLRWLPWLKRFPYSKKK